MTIQQCRYIVEIVDKGSFNEAAKSLFVAQTSISTAVKSIENELNIKIFERSNKGVYLTNDGAEFVRYARQLVEQSDFIIDRYSKPAEIKRLSVSTQHYDFAAEGFGYFLNDCKADDFDFSLREVETSTVISDVEMSFSDVGVIAIKDSDMDLMERFLVKKQISFKPLFRAPFHVYLRKNHPLSDRGKLNFSDLAHYPYITYEQGEHGTSMFTEEFSAKISCDKNVRITDRATLLNLLLITDCYTIGTGTMNHSKLAGGNILSIPLQTSGEYVIGYIVRNDKKETEHTRKFIDVISSYTKKYNF